MVSTHPGGEARALEGALDAQTEEPALRHRGALLQAGAHAGCRRRAPKFHRLQNRLHIWTGCADVVVVLRGDVCTVEADVALAPIHGVCRAEERSLPNA
eukprot:9485164-Pyramimonas_sp.AAC.1